MPGGISRGAGIAGAENYPTLPRKGNRERTGPPAARRLPHLLAFGMCRVRSRPAGTERKRSPEQPGPKGNARITDQATSTRIRLPGAWDQKTRRGHHVDTRVAGEGKDPGSA